LQEPLRGSLDHWLYRACALGQSVLDSGQTNKLSARRQGKVGYTVPHTESSNARGRCQNGRVFIWEGCYGNGLSWYPATNIAVVQKKIRITRKFFTASITDIKAVLAKLCHIKKPKHAWDLIKLI